MLPRTAEVAKAMSALAALAAGRYSLSLAQTVAVLISPFAENADVTAAMKSVVFNVRLPRVLLALAAGAGLASAGAAFQALFSNPLATPDTLGVATGAAAGGMSAVSGAWGSSSPLQMMPPSSSTAGESKESPAALN